MRVTDGTTLRDSATAYPVRVMVLEVASPRIPSHEEEQPPTALVSTISEHPKVQLMGDHDFGFSSFVSVSARRLETSLVVLLNRPAETAEAQRSTQPFSMKESDL